MEGRDSAGAEGAAGVAARGGDVPADPGRIRPARRGRWWRRRQRRPRSGQPVRSGTGHGKEPVRDGADRFSGRTAREGRGGRAGEARRAGQAAGGSGQPAAQSAAELSGALAAGDAAARGRAAAAANGADGAEWPAECKWLAHPQQRVRSQAADLVRRTSEVQLQNGSQGQSGSQSSQSAGSRSLPTDALHNPPSNLQISASSRR